MKPRGEVEMGVIFPVAGVDVACEFQRQPPDTTPVGANVRAYDTIELRGRGGSRSGLTKFINETVNGANVIQHLNVIVDPTTAALAANTIDEFEPDGVTPFQTQVGPDGKLYRLGGSGVQPNANVTPVQAGGIQLVQKRSWHFIQDPTAPFDALSFTYATAPASTANLSVIIVMTRRQGTFPALTVTRSGGGVAPEYTQVGTYVESGPTSPLNRISMWYKVTNYTDTDEQTVIVTPDSEHSGVNIIGLEYSGVKVSDPLDQVATASLFDVPAGTPCTIAGGVGVTAAGALVVAMFHCSENNRPYTDVTSGFSILKSNPGVLGEDDTYVDPGGTSLQEGEYHVVMHKTSNAAGTVTPAYTPGAGGNYMLAAIAASFRKAT